MANTGTNTSSSQQAIITVGISGCIDENFAEDLQKALKIEFPTTVSTDGRIDQLSSTAVSQLSAAIVTTSEFQVLVGEEIGQEDFIRSVSSRVINEESFTLLLEESVNGGFEDEDNLTRTYAFIINEPDRIEEISSRIANNEIAFESLRAALLQDQTFLDYIEGEVTSNASDLLDILTSTGNLSSSREHVVTFPASIPGDFLILDNFSGAGNISGAQLISRTSTQATYLFPNGQAGDSVTVTYALVN